MKIRRALVPLVGVLALVAFGCAAPDGGGGGGGATTTTTTIDPGPPVAVAGASPTVGFAPLTVDFDSTGSLPGTGTGLTYSWDFGDGSPTETGQTTSHNFTSVGTFQARLTLTNSAGTSVSPPITITVTQDPNPKFYVRPTGTTGPTCGPKLNPCSSVVEGQANAVANGVKTLIVAGGSYTGPLSVVSNMEISGGWKQDFSDLGATEVSTIFGTASAVPVTLNGVSNSKLVGLSVQGVARTSGDATGLVVSSGSTGVTIGDAAGPQTVVGGGQGPNATGILVTGGSNVKVENTKVNSGTTIGAGRSAYGIRALGLSVVNVLLSDVTAQPGIAGTGASAGAPGQAARGGDGGGGNNACGASCGGGGGGGGGGTTYGGGNGGTGGSYSGGGSSGANGAGPAAGGGGGGGCGSIFGCGGDAGGGGGGGGGAAGAAGPAGSNSLTSTSCDLYVPTNGGAGTNGAAGSGGGGGGGGKSASASGGGGGGGAAGGNGGQAGTQGGTSGGGSFGVYGCNSTVNLTTSTVTSSTGGVGGAGQAAGRGGDGGRGGNGGGKSCCEAGGGGGGGGGGAGGGGGGAGGGAGGPSIAVFHGGIGTLNLTANSLFRPAIPAAGGLGGAFASPAIGGPGGARGNCALIGGCGGGADGATGASGPTGPSGANGPAGQLFRVWDNGTTTS
ncbi:MAG: PKD domain-containing protein [Microthrixaceae bacterium]